MSHWYIKPNGTASVDREKFYSSNEFKNIVKKTGEIMGTKREDGRCFDGGTCGIGGFCEHCPLVNNDETENFEALACASESIGNLKDQLAALKEENERLKQRNDRLQGDCDAMMVAVSSASWENSTLKARVAELEAMKPVYCVVSGRYDSYMNELYSITDKPIPMADNFVLYRKEPANEG